MKHKFNIVGSVIVVFLPLVNGNFSIAVAMVLLMLFSPVALSVIQITCVLMWLLLANCIILFNLYLNIPTIYSLCLLHAFFFLINTPFYISRIKTLEIARKPLLMVSIQFTFLLLGILFFYKSCFRSYPISYGIWALVCFVYAYYIPRKKKTFRAITKLGYVVLFMFLIAATLLLVEIGVRLFFIVPPQPGGYYMEHKESIFTFRPNSSGSFSLKNNQGEVIQCTITISSQNVRDKEYGEKDGNTFRIVMLGDSYTMGHGLKPEDAIDEVLEHFLREEYNNVNIEVINCGVGGYAPWQERIFLKEYGFAFDPDFVILQLHTANDISGSYSKIGKCLHAIDVKWEQDLLNYRYKNGLSFRIERKLKQLSSTYRVLLAASKSPGFVLRLAKTCRLFPLKHYPAVIPKSERDPYAEACLKQWYPELEEAWGMYADTIKGIRDDCLERNIDLIAFSHGSPNSIMPEYWKNINTQFKDISYEPNKDIRLTNELFAKLNIPYVDVFSTLNKYPCDEIYYIYDGHFTSQGVRVIAECLKNYIIENDLIK